MSDVMQVVPKADSPNTGVKGAKDLAQGLSEALADTYRLVFKTHAYHWNVEGSLFYSIHKLTEEQYGNLFAAADEIAERIRAIGQLTPFRMKEIMDMAVVKDLDKLPSTEAMMNDLVTDHQQVAKRMHALISLADDHSDPVTADLITARSAFHEKAAWMLRAISK